MRRDSCEICGTPLNYHDNGRITCVGCDKKDTELALKDKVIRAMVTCMYEWGVCEEGKGGWVCHHPEMMEYADADETCKQCIIDHFTEQVEKEELT